MSVNYVIVDVETTVDNHRIGTNKAFPFYPKNHIVMTGQRRRSETGVVNKITRPHLPPTLSSPNMIGDDDTKVLIGHNFCFDLHYLRRHNYTVGTTPLMEWLTKNSIWDTQVAEYILTGQSDLYPSLDGCAAKYDAPLKDDRIKVIWEAGYDTYDINREMLSDYLKGDLEATEIVYRAQLKEAEERGMLPLIQAMNRAVIAYHDIEYNGMFVDENTLRQEKDIVTSQRSLSLMYLTCQLPEEIRSVVNLGSSQQLSVLLFGGTYTWKEKVRDGNYKNGNPKFKTVTKELQDPLFKIPAREEWKDKRGFYSTSDDVLKSLINDNSLKTNITSFIRELQDIRAYDKELNSYYNKIPELIVDGFLHQNINNTATATGRLSQNQPNLQNMSSRGNSNLKYMFKSRFGENGYIVEIDYSQLEVIGLAYSCQDEQLIADIQAGIDMHQVTQDKVQRLLPTHLNDKEQRRLVKGINFGLLYGGGIKKLAKISGLPEATIKKIKDALYSTYPRIKEWQEENVEKVKKSKKAIFNKKSPAGFPIHKGTLQTATGRVYTFIEGDSFAWQKSQGIYTDFNRSQICNYPIQGFATGDIVPTVLGEVVGTIHSSHILRTGVKMSDVCYMINTVHDSIMFDIEKDSLDECTQVILNVMERAPHYLKKIYNIDFDLPLKAEATVGVSWKQQVEWSWSGTHRTLLTLPS